MADSPFDSFDDDDIPDAGGQPPAFFKAPDEPVAPMRFRPFAWGALIMELLMDPGAEAEVLAAHGATRDEVALLFKTNKEFQIAVRECKSVIKAQGPNAGFVMRSKMMAEDLLTDMYKLGKSPTTPTALRVRIAENAASWGRLDPKHDKSSTDAGDKGVHFSFNIIGLNRSLPGIVAAEITEIDDK